MGDTMSIGSPLTIKYCISYHLSMKNLWIKKHGKKWKAYHKRWREKNKDRVKSYYNADYQKKYREQNKEREKLRKAKWYLDNIERVKKNIRLYHVNNPSVWKASKARYEKKYPERHKARVLLRSAVRSGKVKKMPCTVCGEKKSQGHHEDYSSPLSVVWLCLKHHKIADTKLRNKKR